MAAFRAESKAARQQEKPTRRAGGRAQVRAAERGAESPTPSTEGRTADEAGEATTGGGRKAKRRRPRRRLDDTAMFRGHRTGGRPCAYRNATSCQELIQIKLAESRCRLRPRDLAALRWVVIGSFNVLHASVAPASGLRSRPV